jgi:Tol biopolymer transport system component
MLANADGSGLVALTLSRGYGSNNAQPTWSPNGRTIAFESTRRDTDLWSIAPDASSLQELTFSLGFDGDPSWSPDGRDRVRDESKRQLRRVRDRRRRHRRATADDDCLERHDSGVVADGDSIAFTSDRTGSVRFGS